jgi:tetratricopeptide (TPR) repeat protein
MQVRLRGYLCLFFASMGWAQHHDMKPPVEKPVALYKGMGNWHHAIAVKNAEAQKFFDQGLALLYGFNRYEALRSFRKAAELDATAAMPWWGMAMATGPYVNMGTEGDGDLDSKAACEAVATGLKIAGAPPRERAYLEAAATRCPEYKPEAYAAAMKRLAEQYPDDLDAATLYAESLMVPVRWRWYGADGKAAAGVAEAEHTLEQVLRRWPEHPGANHYYIHAVESSPTPERAVPSAQRLMGIVPWAGHMVHMPAHIWLVLGDYELAATVNQRAGQVDREYFTASNVTGVYNMYYVHNLHFVTYARSMQGHRAETVQAAKAMSEAILPAADVMPEMADAFLAVALLSHVRVQAWDEVLQMPQPAEKFLTQTAMWRYARVMALLARGDRAGAVRENAAFEAARKKIPAERPWGTLNTSGDVLNLAGEILAARLSSTPAEALPHWEKAIGIQDALIYDEPPAWYYPVRESMGAALVRAGRGAEAERVFREGLRRSPRNGWMLFGLIESLKAQGKSDGMDELKRELDAAWAKSDLRQTLEAM